MIKSKILNIEALRFIFALAVIGFHVAYKQQFKVFGFSELHQYLSTGYQAVIPFFIIAFFFVCLKYKPEQSLVDFVKRKWIRMAPAIIFVTGIFYLVHLFGFWEFNWAANLEQILLIHDWSDVERWGQAVRPAWWCSEFLLMSVFYIGLRKTFSEKYIPFIMGVSIFTGWRIFITAAYTKAFMIQAMGPALFSLGVAYFLAEAYKKYLLNKDSTNQQNNVLSRSVIGWTFTEILMFYLIVQKLFFNMASPLNYILLVSCFVVLFYSFITNRGWLGRLLNHDISEFFGRYAYGMFICHIFILNLCRKVIFPKYTSWVVAHTDVAGVLMLMAIFAMAMFTYHCVEQPIMNAYKRLKHAKN